MATKTLEELHEEDRVWRQSQGICTDICPIGSRPFRCTRSVGHSGPHECSWDHQWVMDGLIEARSHG